MSKEIKEGYKMTKLGWIPEDWEVIQMSNICTFFSGGTPKSTQSDFYGGSIPFIRSAEIDAVKTNLFLTEAGLNNSSAKIVENGDLLMALYGANSGEIAICKIQGAINQAVLCIRTSESKVFLLNYFLKEQNSILAKYLQGGQGNLSAQIIKRIKIPLPPLPEQKKIADILSTWDKAIETTQALIEKLQLRKKGLMQKLLSGKKRLPGFSGEWEEVKLGDLFKEIKRKNDGGNHEPLTISSKLGFVSQRQKFDKVIAGSSLLKYIQLEKFDFSYNKGNSKTYPMGCIFLLEEFESAVVPFVYISFHAINNIDNYFYKYWFENHGLDRQLKAIITSGARGDGLLNVSKKDFFKLKLPYTDIQEQAAIAQILTKADEEIDQTQEYLEQLQEQKRGLMQQLLTGQRRVVV